MPVSAVATDFTQLPLQQALLLMHTSFFCLQNETSLEQVPLMQPPEQHWLSSVHALPEPRHAVPSDWHRPPVQSPLQHCAFVVHAPFVGVSVTHAMLAHAPFTQFPEQQSELTKHAWAFEEQDPPRLPHTFGESEPQIPPPGHAPEPTPHV